ncbi:hypothetical protein BC938DRAFT_478206 [Jimgerdemannia flammicorona]|uniref:Chromo shadow domain-containing protein n=1 Tax=Jimgerdemannia flammicorona TaxID=994334 RepID=A0A433QN78_9FUNG|nr:hypothetical protein BC938DRAFT_478206 [Jimgerdemannia flammicorona]
MAASCKAVKEAPSNSSGMQKSNQTATENKLTNVDVGEGEDGKEDDQDLVMDGSWPIDGLDWETEVREVATMEWNSKNELMVYLTWNNSKNIAHPASEVNPKCPQKIIKFYESHLRFKSVEPYSA